MTTRVLYLYGGWPGHDPYDVADWMREQLDELGYDVEESNDIFTLDRDLSDFDLILDNWNNAVLSETLTASQELYLLSAVEAGTGFAAWPGGGAAFRGSVMYHMTLGADLIYHPAGEGVRHPYGMRIVDTSHAVTNAVSDFSVATEQYYMNVDSRNHVLVETTFDGAHMPWLEGQTMPQVWTKTWGQGRVFYDALGHYLDDITAPDSAGLLRQGSAWAARR